MMLGFNAALRQDANGSEMDISVAKPEQRRAHLGANGAETDSIARQSADDQSRIRSVDVGTDTSKLADAEVELLQYALVAP